MSAPAAARSRTFTWEDPAARAVHEFECRAAGGKLVLASMPAALAVKSTVELMGVAKYRMDLD